MKKEYIRPTAEVVEIIENISMCSTSNPNFMGDLNSTVTDYEELSRKISDLSTEIFDAYW